MNRIFLLAAFTGLSLMMSAATPAPSAVRQFDAEGYFKLPVSLTPAELERLKDAVGGFLRDPYSARYEFTKMQPHTNIFCGTVNAKNGFGGYRGKQGFLVIVSFSRGEMFFSAPQFITSIEDYALLKCVKVGYSLTLRGISE